jgi:hypothetical protein
MEFRASFISFMRSAFYSLLPTITSGTLIFFLPHPIPLLAKIAFIISLIISVFLFPQSIFVHLQKLYLDEENICVSNIFRATNIRWVNVYSAVLRERENVISRTDRLLILNSPRRNILFQTSILSTKDEELVLEMVRKKTKLVIKKDKKMI